MLLKNDKHLKKFKKSITLFFNISLNKIITLNCQDFYLFIKKLLKMMMQYNIFGVFVKTNHFVFCICRYIYICKIIVKIYLHSFTKVFFFY